VPEDLKGADRLGFGRHADGTLKLDGSSVLESLGGVWGVLEAAVPGTAYAVAFAVSHSVILSVMVAGGLSLLFVLAQILRKRPLTQAISGLVGIGVAAFLTLHDGGTGKHAIDYYLQGIITNIAYFAGVTLSILIRWPIVGVLVGVFTSGTNWRKDKSLVRRYSAVTLIWVALFGARLLVELPLYFGNSVVALGFVKLIMGVPLYALAGWFTWLSLRPLLRNAD
jgi:hypothetical protein